MEELLNKSFENVNNWLKYAETKCATLLAANGVFIWGLARAMLTGNFDNTFVLAYFNLVILMLLISLVLLLVSFLPSFDIPWLFKLSEPDKENDNLLYFEHISKYTPIKYLEEMSLAANFSNYQRNKLELMLAKQIITNSVITRRKFIIFDLAIWLTISSVITPIGSWIIKRRMY